MRSLLACPESRFELFPLRCKKHSTVELWHALWGFPIISLNGRTPTSMLLTEQHFRAGRSCRKLFSFAYRKAGYDQDSLSVGAFGTSNLRCRGRRWVQTAAGVLSSVVSMSVAAWALWSEDSERDNGTTAVCVPVRPRLTDLFLQCPH